MHQQMTVRYQYKQIKFIKNIWFSSPVIHFKSLTHVEQQLFPLYKYSMTASAVAIAKILRTLGTIDSSPRLRQRRWQVIKKIKLIIQ